MEKRVGRFVVEGRFLEGADRGEGVNLFTGMLVLSTERDWANDRITYYAWHPDFAPCQRGALIPFYEARFTSPSTIPTWVRVGPVVTLMSRAEIEALGVPRPSRVTVLRKQEYRPGWWDRLLEGLGWA